MMLPFNDSWFVVTFTGECPESKLIQGWENVMNYIDESLDVKPGTEYSVRGPCCELHDEDHWTLLGHSYDTDDQRHTFSKSEFDYCVGLAIVRLTELVEIHQMAAREKGQG